MQQAIEPLKPKLRLKEITSEASNIEFYPNISIKKYARSAAQLFYIAGVYELDNNVEMAFRSYTRYIVLLVEHLPKHPEFQKFIKEEKAEYQKMMKAVQAAFETAERLKDVLLDQLDVAYEKFMKEMKEQETSGPLEPFDMRGSMPSSTTSAIYSQHDRVSPVTGSELPDQSSFRSLTVDRTTKPTSAVLNKHSLRPVLVPNSLVQQFLEVSSVNTSRNIETCGILSGKLVQGKFIVTHVIVPKQSGTADSCLTQHEEEIFVIQDKLGLITLGWIHTHPCHSAFLSSVDMHTHCSYQLMFPEAVAIVCSPKHNEVGLFMLTPSHGLKIVGECKQIGFHPHKDDPPLFQQCDHASLTDATGLLIDLRNDP
ncbi:USP8 dimer and JAB domain containing protein [Trichuris trichiura]|uniref:USP8 dimer and JAB domain containing protein n=1 Tax=Trichuris trichiura TaxID=36087 RepID=A0A077Z8B5_TRITR|nr:USP8 dimer and JAB domain containing protein [Trichuris trichiura]